MASRLPASKPIETAICSRQGKRASRRLRLMKMKDPVQVGMLIVQVIGLGGLFWYAWETREMRKASQEQVNISQALIRAAMDQIEGLSKPCLTLCGDLRDPGDAIWAASTQGAVGGTIARNTDGKFVVQNIGNGVALN